LFVKPAQSVNSYLSEPGYLDNALKYSGQQKEQIEQIASFLVKDRPITFEECIIWARLQFEEKYNNAIRQLLFSLPKDAVTNSGQPFWSSPKRAPDPLTFNWSDVSMPCYTWFVLQTDSLQAHTPPVHHRCSQPPCVQLWVTWRD
jgi:ubiquitin-activating enzyme E1